jgi:hypothetical protein
LFVYILLLRNDVSWTEALIGVTCPPKPEPGILLVPAQTFDRPKEFDLKKYDDDGRFGFGEGKMVRLIFRIERNAGLHLPESPLSNDQQVAKLDDGKLEITATVVDSAMLEWWLRGFGDTASHVRRIPMNLENP